MDKKRLTIFLVLAAIIFILGIGFYYFSTRTAKDEINIALIHKFEEAKPGSVNTQLLFADKGKVIIYDYPGLIVYDIADKKITRTVDFQEIGVKNFQGDDAYSIYASKTGDKIFFEKANQMNRMSYDVENNILLKNIDKEDTAFTKENYFNGYIDNTALATNNSIPLSQIIKTTDGNYIYLANQSSLKLEQLEIVIVKGTKKEVFSIFSK